MRDAAISDAAPLGSERVFSLLPFMHHLCAGLRFSPAWLGSAMNKTVVVDCVNVCVQEDQTNFMQAEQKFYGFGKNHHRRIHVNYSRLQKK